MLASRVVEPEAWCHRCGSKGTPPGTVVGRLRTPLVPGDHEDGRAKAKLFRRILRWTLEALAIGIQSWPRSPRPWDAASISNDAVLAEGKRLLVNAPGSTG